MKPRKNAEGALDPSADTSLQRLEGYGWKPAVRRAGLALLVCLIPCPVLKAGLFPQLSSRYSVGDPLASNPLDRLREGPKAVAAGDLNGDGVDDVVAGNLDGSVSVLLSLGQDGRAEQVLYRAGGSIRSVAVADFNGDGIQDVAAADILGGVAVMLGNGHGSLSLISRVAVGPARSLAVADCNSDGANDILVASSAADCDQGPPGGAGLCVLLGNGDGTFQNPTCLLRNPGSPGSPGGCLYDVAFADLNADGDVDALVLDYYQREIAIFAGNGDGNFAPGPRLALRGEGARAFCVAYLDERVVDGVPRPGAMPDIVAANRTSATLDVFLGQGGFAFARPVSVPCGDSPRSVAAGDLNGDGLAELIVANRNANTISVLRGLGEARFGSPLELAAGTSPREIVLADLTGDGALDAAVANRISGDISIFVGRRGLAGFLVPESYYPAGITPVGVVSEDFNEDGFPDAATVNLRSHDVRVRSNAGTGAFGEETAYPVGYQPSSMASADVNADGHEDLVVACMGSAGEAFTSSARSLFTLLGKGDGSFATVSSTLEASLQFQPYWLRLGDLSGDAAIDAAIGGSRGELLVLRGRGDGKFEGTAALPSGERGSPITMALGDFNSDGLLDIATSGGRILINCGSFFDSRWKEVERYPVSEGDWVVEASDLDRDGALDLVVALTFVEPDPIAVHFGRGDGTFLLPTIYGAGMGVVAIQVADMDRDGILDIVTGNRCTADVTILKGVGNRKFDRLETIRTYSVEGLAVEDLNGDGRLDLVGAGLALWVVLQGSKTNLVDPKTANPAGILPAEGLHINEVMALNKSFFMNEKGKTPDWLEIYNHSAEAKALGGWRLRQLDRQGKTEDWGFPQATSIGPGGHLVVFCDADFQATGLHAPFSLSSDGEGVALMDPSGTEISRVDFPAMPADVSYARFVDGARYLCYNPVPTMGDANVKPTNLSPSLEGRDPFLAAGGTRLGVGARTFDDIGIAYASVHFKVEGQPTFSEMILLDDGAHADGVAGDGILGCLLPEMPPGTKISYYFRIIDLEGQVSMDPDDPSDAAALFEVTVPPSSQGLRLSEAFADRQDGASQDWMEIANCGAFPQSLEGLALTKDYFRRDEAWRFPGSLSLDPGKALVVICDRMPGAGTLHASFRLSKEGDGILLVRADDSWTILDSLSFGPLPAGKSFGILDCGSEPGILDTPTPGELNSLAATKFVRGDANSDCRVDMSDAIGILCHLFLGSKKPACLKGADTDDSGALNITDGVYLLSHLFAAGPKPPAPYPDIGNDATSDALTCDSYPKC